MYPNPWALGTMQMEAVPVLPRATENPAGIQLHYITTDDSIIATLF